MKQFAFCQRITNLEDTVIRKTNDITGIGFFDSALTLCHKLSRRREPNRLTLTYMQIRLITDKLA